MKAFLFLPFVLLGFNRLAFSQGSCSAAPINPREIPQPTQTGIVSSTCSTLVVKWQGSAGQSYCVKATYFNSATNQNEIVSGIPACDANENCTATLAVIAGAQVTWIVQAISNGFASNPVSSNLESPIPACDDGGTNDNICFKPTMGPGVLQPTKAGIVSSTCSTLIVKWQGNIGQSYCVSATYFNTSTNKKDTVYGTNIVCDTNQNCTDTIPVISGTKVTWSVQALSNGNGSYPVINLLEYPIRGCSGSDVTFCGKVILQGAYDASTRLMNNELNSSDILQSDAFMQPYNISEFGYTGTETVGVGFFAARRDIVDWVLVELRDPNFPSTIVARRAVFVKQDGTLIDTGGVNTHITFPGVASGMYHVAVRHRNHIGIITPVPVDFTCTACYDFTTSSFKSFRNQPYPSPVQIGTVWTMRAGDANTNKNVKYNGSMNDKNTVLSRVGLTTPSNVISGYFREDLNMDGKVRYTGAANDKNVILSVVGLATPNHVIIEQVHN